LRTREWQNANTARGRAGSAGTVAGTRGKVAAGANLFLIKDLSRDVTVVLVTVTGLRRQYPLRNGEMPALPWGRTEQPSVFPGELPAPACRVANLVKPAGARSRAPERRVPGRVVRFFGPGLAGKGFFKVFRGVAIFFEM